MVPTDVSDPAAAAFLIETAVSSFGGIDVLVNNAGVSMMARFDEVTDLSVFESLMRVNYLGCVYLTHHALPHLKASRGQIVVMASLAGLTGVPTRTGYAASKHAVIGFYDSLRIELADSGVDVTVIAPDFVRVRDPSPLHRARRAAAGAEPDAGGAHHDRGGVRRAHVRAMERRQRMAILSARGRWGRFVRLIAPGLIDRIAARAVREGR